jgi:hypothetical protein
MILLSARSTPANSILFNLKRGQEKVFQASKFTIKSKVEYQQSLLGWRLWEISQLIDSGDYDLLYSACLRYSTTAGQITDLVLTTNNQILISSINSFFGDQILFNQKLLANYPQSFNKEWKYLVDNINYLNIYRGKLSSNAN